MMLKKTFLVVCLICLLCAVTALECDNDKLKITIKTDPEEYKFDDYEEYLLQGTVAYSVRKFCGGGTDVDPDTYACGASYPTIDTQNVKVTDKTDRIAMCVQVDDIPTDTVRVSLKESKANLNGALILTDDVLFVDGVEPTLEPAYDPDFATWIIVYIVLACLILLAGIAMVVYTKYYQKKQEKAEKFSMDEDIVSEHSEQSEIQRGRENLSFDPEMEAVTPL